MDEVRLQSAEAFAETTLRVHDFDDAAHFRLGVLRREASGDIAYSRQRDHSAHTVNNWLLGWYLYGHVPRLVAALRQAQEARGMWQAALAGFGQTWQCASLLHDIGYIFDGSVGALDPASIARQPLIGLGVVKDYFHHRFWVELGITSRVDRDAALKLCGVEEPDFSRADTLAGIAYALRSLPNLEAIRAAACGKETQNTPTGFGVKGGLPADAFDLWRTHYRAYGQDSMVARIDHVERAFYRQIYLGIGEGIRILDHGVCSGLVLLQASAYYNAIHHGMGVSPPDDPEGARVFDIIRSTNYVYDALDWWKTMVWATAAAATHNLMQASNGVLDAGLSPLRLEEDPLTYLGILVDILQEWDRYTVVRSSMLGSSPIQSIDVTLAAASGRVMIDYHDVQRAGKTRSELDATLVDWRHLVDVLPT